MFHTVFRAILLVALACAEQIPEFQGGPGGIETIKFDDYVRMTKNLTMPAIVKSFFNVGAFADICACSPDASLFDSINLPFTGKGNVNYKMREAQHKFEDMKFDAINAGVFYREHACAADKDDYIFYDINNGAMLAASVQDFFRKKIDPMLRSDQAITDETYDYWFNEIFIGGSTKEYPLPSNGSGSAPHRAPVLNYYHQVCGKKRWHIAHHGASFGEIDKYQWMLYDDDMLAFMKDPQVYVGHTEPGDVLLNPPWLWHFVQTDRGFNFAVTYKQTGYGWWAAVNKMDPTQVAVNMQYGAHDMRDQKLPTRPVFQIDLYTGTNSFIVDLWDIRVPWWILRRHRYELSIFAAITGSLVLNCCVCSCSRTCRSREADKVKQG
mmetsp:Transcript_33225/g.60185  ORF Transcript_33225/g.60185 Transcript_33225/m.60185 type:complete len:380 (-) Transcript_33225:100-1239(-)